MCLAYRTRAFLNPTAAKNVEDLLSSAQSLEDALAGLSLQHELKTDDKEYKAKAAAKFPLAKAFK